MSSYLPPTQSVWAINDTVNNTVTIPRGLLEASTSDNINPVALLSCEALGNVLPLCVETRYKIERLARRNYTSHVLNFIKAQIGYRKGDVVELLSNSDAGIRFLCLAATFCSMDHYEAARRIDSLLQATQSKDQLRPTVRQLQVMMGVLMSKLVLSDFAKHVAGWEIWLRGVLQAHSATQGGYMVSYSTEVPPKAALEHFMLELGRNHPLGEEKRIEIRSRPQFVPWTIAFIKWSLGAPPLVRVARGSVVLEQDSPIFLTILPFRTFDTGPRTGGEKMEQDFFAMSLKLVKGLRQIIFEGSHEEIRWRGAMDVRAWMQYQIGLLYDSFWAVRVNKKLRAAIGQALYFIIKHVPMRLLLWHENYFKAMDDNPQLKDLSQHFLSIGPRFRPSAFPTADSRLRIAQQILGDQLSLVHKDIDEDQTLHPGNLAEIFKSDCHTCRQRLDMLDYEVGGDCSVNELLEKIGNIGAALLVFSLFGIDLETFPLIAGGSAFDSGITNHRDFNLDQTRYAITSTSWPSLIVTGWQALMQGRCEVLGCDARALFRYSAELLGHGKIKRTTVISSKFGQVIYPAFFEATGFMREDFLHFSVFPGILRRDKMDFESLLSVSKVPREMGSGILEELSSDDASAGMSDRANFHEEHISVESVQEAVEEEHEGIAEDMNV